MNVCPCMYTYAHMCTFFETYVLCTLYSCKCAWIPCIWICVCTDISICRCGSCGMHVAWLMASAATCAESCRGSGAIQALEPMQNADRVSYIKVEEPTLQKAFHHCLKVQVDISKFGRYMHIYIYIYIYTHSCAHIPVICKTLACRHPASNKTCALKYCRTGCPVRDW